MSLKAMADNVRAERRRLEAAAPAQRIENQLAVKRQWEERKRRAWDKACPIFEAAFQRQFSPHRFWFTTGTQNRRPYVKVSINYEGKLWAHVKAFDREGARYLYVRPIDAPEDKATLLDALNESLMRDRLYDKVAALVEEWGLA
jgi:hypothetical protein